MKPITATFIGVFVSGFLATGAAVAAPPDSAHARISSDIRNPSRDDTENPATCYDNASADAGAGVALSSPERRFSRSR